MITNKSRLHFTIGWILFPEIEQIICAKIDNFVVMSGMLYKIYNLHTSLQYSSCLILSKF